ncbi:glycosyltransferase family 39 protein [Fomitiporia mediterranea MF3/22]|uniref:glycosyltransferase family 39 protein n=1 Tax=Fomitiporia mediterranea (strain MF3/22) TaxID=694068 RepID=UPI000440743F|nr:glycosyltransferase family 39 protein [Fomitiporia mediterranea MF3/22]EJD00774.1 glycosyltransferase family 39 protein [Fomitiporia mediterranea MF3/22]
MEKSNFRARRPPSPPPMQPQVHTQRFPYAAKEHMDADERRAAASKGAAPKPRNYHPPGGLKLTMGEWKLLAFIMVIAAGVRLFRLSRPNSVVFDEVHFGKFASKYIKTQYYVDVHPPLAKLLITLAAFIFGYDGHFDFKDIGKVYEAGVPYVAMRMVPATLGLFLVPLTYLTLRALDCRATTALLGAFFVTFENGLITQSRHILLDSPLIFFTALATFFWIGFCNEDKHKPFTQNWWTWLTLSGLGLGAVVSCKWVGLFTIATIGFSTILQLWRLLGDLRVSPRLFIKHFLARALCLIAVPIIFYMIMFAIHFQLLQSSGDGDGFMSSAFQHTLSGRGMQDTYADVGFGSEVSIRHLNTQGGYLHSHAHDFPTGSKQQQITLYPHRDSNNNWRIENGTADVFAEGESWETAPLKYLTTGSVIKLQHLSTGKRLHSHDVRPPISEVDFQNEVSGYGSWTFPGDANDNWVVEIEHGAREDSESSKRLRTLRTVFRLRHQLQNCYLFSHKVKLPDWGYEQQEVTCNKNAKKANSLWYVETAMHHQLNPDAEKVNYKLPGFFGKFFELQRVMWITNAGLTDRHTYDSRPSAWPRLRRGINFWVKDHRQIYLLGNPTVWWLSTLAVLAYAGVRGILILRQQRGFRDFENTRVTKYDNMCGFLFMGWALHYFPFYLMARQLFLHHYFPALWFSILLCCTVFDLVTSSLRPRVRLYIAAGMLLVAIWSFSYFSPLAYGGPWTRGACEKARWLKTWDFACNDFPIDYSAYEGLGVGGTANPMTSAAIPAASVVGGEEAGRAAVVVEGDAMGKVPPAANDAETTTGRGAVAEPGWNAFGEEAKDIKSHGRPDEGQGRRPDVEKEISTVMVNPSEGTTTETTATVEPGKESMDNDALSGVDPVKSENGDVKENTGDTGPDPLEHDAQEAELARNDLFADEAS